VPSTSSDTTNVTHHGPVWLPVAAVVVTGLVINWISDEIRVSPPILLLLAAVALVLLVAAERSARVSLPFTAPTLDAAKLALLAVLIGAAVGAMSVLPLAQERVVTGPWGYFHNYEAGATAILVVLAATSAVRRRDAVQWLVFLGASVAGMTLSIVYLKPGNDFVSTFAGWLIAAALVTTVLANSRDLAKLFLAFLGFNERR
jgi:hypothetical protein